MATLLTDRVILCTCGSNSLFICFPLLNMQNSLMERQYLNDKANVYEGPKGVYRKKASRPLLKNYNDFR